MRPVLTTRLSRPGRNSAWAFNQAQDSLIRIWYDPSSISPEDPRLRILDRLLTSYRKRVKPYLPSSVRGLFSRALDPSLKLRGMYDFWRVRPGVTRVLGLQFRRNRRVIATVLTA